MLKLSRSKIELFLECPRCFWLDVKKGIKRPQPAPYTINNAIDYLLKQEFDVYRGKGEAHPAMKGRKIDAVPYATPEIHQWRNNFVGIQHHHRPTDFLVYGAVDDVWINPKKELMVVDYKATGANQHQIYDSYRRQMEIYQWLLRQNDFKVSPTGYFVFARVNKANGFGSASPSLAFDLFIEGHEGDASWIEDVLEKAKRVLERNEKPPAAEECSYCRFSRGAEE